MDITVSHEQVLAITREQRNKAQDALAMTQAGVEVLTAHCEQMKAIAARVPELEARIAELEAKYEPKPAEGAAPAEG